MWLIRFLFNVENPPFLLESSGACKKSKFNEVDVFLFAV